MGGKVTSLIALSSAVVRISLWLRLTSHHHHHHHHHAQDLQSSEYIIVITTKLFDSLLFAYLAHPLVDLVTFDTLRHHPHKARTATWRLPITFHPSLSDCFPTFVALEHCTRMQHFALKFYKISRIISRLADFREFRCFTDGALETMQYERVSETDVFPSLDRVSWTLCLLHYVTETSHLYTLRDFWRHFCLSRAAAHSNCCFFCAVYKYSYYLECTTTRHIRANFFGRGTTPTLQLLCFLNFKLLPTPLFAFRCMGTVL